MSKDAELRTLRQELSQRQRGPGKRLAMGLRKRVGRYGRRRSLEGASMSEIARELDLDPRTLRSAMEETEPEGLRPVLVVDEPARRQVVVRGPGGLEIEGLDVEGLASLIRALT